MRHFTSAYDVPDLPKLLDAALAFKKQPRFRENLGQGRTLGMVFLNPSTRTRISTQIAARNLGMETIVFNASSDGWSLEFGDADVVMNGASVEHIREAARVFGEYFDVLAVRSFPNLQNRDEDFSEKILKQFIEHAGIPVVSLESATLHPLQSFADLLTIKELHLEKRPPRIALTWAPHLKPLPQCVANSFAQWILAWGGAELTIACPPGHELDKKFTAGAKITHDQNAALAGADFVYVKNWSATEPYGQLICDDQNWLLDPEKLAKTNRAKVMHCLPVRRNLELSSAILDSPDAVVVQQAGNRVWAAQAVLAEILKFDT